MGKHSKHYKPNQRQLLHTATRKKGNPETGGFSTVSNFEVSVISCLFEWFEAECSVPKMVLKSSRLDFDHSSRYLLLVQFPGVSTQLSLAEDTCIHL